MSDALLGYGAVYEIRDGAGSGSWNEIAEVVTITPPNSQAEDVDVTHMQSPDRTREFIAGMIDLGDCSFEINWVPGGATDTLLQSLRVSGAVRDHRVTWANGVIWTFRAYIKGFEPQAPVDGKMSATITCKVAQSYSITAAAAPTNQLLPSIAGGAQVGLTITAVEGKWTGGPTFTYQWQENNSGWTNISGATSKTYTITGAVEGNPLRVQVTGTNSAGSLTVNSAATADVIPA